MEKVEAALRLNPFPPPHTLRFVGALIAVRRLEEAIRVLVKCVAEVPSMSSGHFWLTLAYMESGLEEQGRQQALEILRLIPEFSVSACPHLLACQDAGTRDRYASLLLTAGLPD